MIADSDVFTAASDSADPRYAGTALATQTAIGFLVAVLAVQLVGFVADALGWRWTFLPLTVGP